MRSVGGIRRKRVNRKVTAEVTEEAGILVVSPPLEWSIQKKNGSKVSIDFNVLQQARKELATSFNRALWTIKSELVEASMRPLLNSTPIFWEFLAARESQGGAAILRLSDCSYEVIDDFRLWLAKKRSKSGNKKGEIWDYNTQRKCYSAIKRILEKCRDLFPSKISADFGTPLCAYPGAHINQNNRPRYSEAEAEAILKACGRDIDLFKKKSILEKAGPDQVLIVYLIIFGFFTGWNPQVLYDMTRNSLQKIPGGNRVRLIGYKKRGYSVHHSSFSVIEGNKLNIKENSDGVLKRNVPKRISEYFDDIKSYTEKYVELAACDIKEFIFIIPMEGGARKAQVVQWNDAKSDLALKKFVKRHQLKSDKGDILRLNMSRLRPTFASMRYSRNTTLLALQELLGHKSLATTIKYIDRSNEAKQELSRIVCCMVDDLKSEGPGSVISVGEQATSQRMTETKNELIAGGLQNQNGGRCLNPLVNSEDGAKPASCRAFFPCYRGTDGNGCRHMVVLSTDLHKIFSVYFYLKEKLNRVPLEHRYDAGGFVLDVIDRVIVPKFPPKLVEEAKLDAWELPHPAWERKGL